MVPNSRIALECSVLNTESLRTAIQRSGVKGLVSDRREYHFTVLYLGRPSEVLDAVQRARSDYAHRPLDDDRFVTALRAWLQRHVGVVSSETQVAGDRLIRLGDAATLLLDRIPRELTGVHGHLVDSFATFLHEELNVPDGRALMRNDSAFGFSGKTWIPHITVGSISTALDSTLDEIEVVLGPMQVRNWASLVGA